MTSVVERLRRDRPVFSVEFMPPRDDEDEQRLWNAIRSLEGLDPAFVSVTYGAGGSSRDRTIRTTGRVAHLRLTAEGERRLARVFEAHANERARLHEVLAELQAVEPVAAGSSSRAPRT